MDLGLTGKRALVTAASKGIGRAVADALLDEGCRVCISSRDAERIAAAAVELGGDGREVHARPADLGVAEDCSALLAWAADTLGGLDILVNNTGGPPAGRVLDLDDGTWHAAFESVFMSALRLSRLAIPEMRAAGGGAIVNLASLTAKQPIDGLALSNALRPALVGMAKTLSREAAPEVRVNSIATEHILTDRIREIAGQVWAREGERLEETLDRRAREVALGRYGSPRELANVVVFLCSDAASFVTGVTIAVDGGLDRALY